MIGLNIKEKEYRFIIVYLLFEILVMYALTFSDMEAFALVPYVRLVTILFSFVYFSLDIINIKIQTKIKQKLVLGDFLMLLWFITGFISLFIGVINRNPFVYLATDFFYIFFGSILFYITRKSNFIGANLSYSFFNKTSIILIVLSVIYIFFELQISSCLLVLMTVLIYINIIKKKYLYAFFIILPYFLIVASSNRTQLIVFVTMVLILFLRYIRKYFSIKSVLLFSFIFLVVLFLLRVEILEGVLEFVNPHSNIGYRINQILIIFKEGVDFDNPFFTSITQRILEAQAVLEYWTSSITSFIFGSGSGGVIDGSEIYNDASVLNSALLGAENVHNIHLLPFALIFRYGIFGFILFINLLILAYRSFILVLNEREDYQKIFCNLFFVFWVIYSIPAASFLWTLPLFWILYGCLNNIESKSRNNEEI